MEDNELYQLFMSAGLRAVFDAGMLANDTNTAEANSWLAQAQADHERTQHAVKDLQPTPAPNPSTLIENLGLNVKARGLLLRASIKTIDQLTEMTKAGLISIPGFGPNSLEDVITKL